MPTSRQLVVSALRRTGDAVPEDASRVPPDRWEDAPAGGMRSLRQVLQHLIECEDWWLQNMGVPESERPSAPDLASMESAATMAGVFASARSHLVRVVEDLPEEWFHRRPPACEYGDLQTGADLLHYAAEHTYYHDGQIQMLEMAFAVP